MADPRPEFLPWHVTGQTVAPNGDVASTGYCPDGYTVIDADQDQNGATPSMVISGTQYYLRCIRNDIFANPAASTTEPPVPPDTGTNWSNPFAVVTDPIQKLLASITGGIGTGVTLAIAAAAVLYLLPGTVARTARARSKNPRRRKR